MANDYIEVTHSCGHKEKHHFTKSAVLNKRAAKYKEKELCGECLEKQIEKRLAEEKAKKETALAEAGVKLPLIEAVSDKQRNFAEAKRVEKLYLLQNYSSKLEERLAEAFEEGKMTEDEIDLFRQTLKNIYSYKSAKFWIEGLTRLDYELFTHLICLMIATHPEYFNNEDVLKRMESLVNYSWRESYFQICINDYKDLL